MMLMGFPHSALSTGQLVLEEEIYPSTTKGYATFGNWSCSVSSESGRGHNTYIK